ncbi:MAG: phage holin family protein [Candidatus Liptonbacteria bacterium]|nr:phage holin family protein [Candidatus Liptonbacteria bacterium]
MRWIAHLLVLAIVNFFALFVAASYISGFTVNGGVREVLLIALLLTLLNVLLKPVLTLLFGPVIVLTLGIGLILVNALVLFILDTLSKNLTIDSVLALLYGTLLIGIINWIAHLGLKPRPEV